MELFIYEIKGFYLSDIKSASSTNHHSICQSHLFTFPIYFFYDGFFILELFQKLSFHVFYHFFVQIYFLWKFLKLNWLKEIAAVLLKVEPFSGLFNHMFSILRIFIKFWEWILIERKNTSFFIILNVHFFISIRIFNIF